MEADRTSQDQVEEERRILERQEEGERRFTQEQEEATRLVAEDEAQAVARQEEQARQNREDRQAREAREAHQEPEKREERQVYGEHREQAAEVRGPESQGEAETTHSPLELGVDYSTGKGMAGPHVRDPYDRIRSFDAGQEGIEYRMMWGRPEILLGDKGEAPQEDLAEEIQLDQAEAMQPEAEPSMEPEAPALSVEEFAPIETMEVEPPKMNLDEFLASGYDEAPASEAPQASLDEFLAAAGAVQDAEQQVGQVQAQAQGMKF